MAQRHRFEAGTWIWLPDAEECWLPGKAAAAFTCVPLPWLATLIWTARRQGEAGEAIVDGRTIAVTAADSLRVEDMVQFNDLSEGPLLHNLRKRYKDAKIYTWVGAILIAVNPFKVLPALYGVDVLSSYVGSSAEDGRAPHCYSIGAMAYENLMEFGRSQAICISGESGAGKTESMKLMLQFLAEASDRRISGVEGRKKGLVPVEAAILQTNPLIESFGNAKTLRNDNSSRFGKYTTLHFSRSSGSITSASIVTYLLEKSRVPLQAAGERNFHAFYQLLARCRADEEMTASLQLFFPDVGNNQDDWRYLSGGAAEEEEEEESALDYSRDFGDVAEALRALDFAPQETRSVWAVVAAILNLGNVGVDETQGGEASALAGANRLAFESAAGLLGVEDPALLEEALLSRLVGKRSVYRAVLTKAQALDARDALAKGLFSRLFDFLITKINGALQRGLVEDQAGSTTCASAAHDRKTIGVLDIFGFEFFETNSFEQLCINFCNEKLQFFFNDHIFSQEAAEYDREGVDLALVDFENNGPTLELLEHRTRGIFAMLDEECLVPQGSDLGFVHKVLRAHHHHPSSPGFSMCSLKERDSDRSFAVVHYAARVRYTVDGFLDKNRDQLLDGLIRVGALYSTDAVVRGLFVADLAHLQAAAAAAAPKAARGKKGAATATAAASSSSARTHVTLGGLFVSQLGVLVKALEACEPHFVRCIKPNDLKQPLRFDAAMAQSQMRCAGVLEVCKIRQAGFPSRSPFGDFVRRYAHVAHLLDGKQQPDDEGMPLTQRVDRLLDLLKREGFFATTTTVVVDGGGKKDDASFARGKTKVFLRTEARDRLEAARERALVHVMVAAQSAGRRFVARCRYDRWAALVCRLADAVARSDLVACDAALAESYLLPNGGKHLAQHGRALAFKKACASVQGAVDACLQAIDRQAPEDLRQALADLSRVSDPTMVAALIEDATLALRRLDEEPRTRRALADAQRAGDAAGLGRALAEATDLFGEMEGFVLAAKRALDDCVQREACLDDLFRQCQGGAALLSSNDDYDELEALALVLRRAAELGIAATEPRVLEATRRLEGLEARAAFVSKVAGAVDRSAASRDPTELEALLAAAGGRFFLGQEADPPALGPAHARVAYLKRENTACDALRTAMKRRDLEALDGGLLDVALLSETTRDDDDDEIFFDVSSALITTSPAVGDLVATAETLRARLAEERACDAALVKAAAEGSSSSSSSSLAEVRAAVDRAAALSVAGGRLTRSAVEAAEARLADLEAEQRRADEAKHAEEARQRRVLALEAALAEAAALDSGVGAADLRTLVAQVAGDSARLTAETSPAVHAAVTRAEALDRRAAAARTAEEATAHHDAEAGLGTTREAAAVVLEELRAARAACADAGLAVYNNTATTTDGATAAEAAALAGLEKALAKAEARDALERSVAAVVVEGTGTGTGTAPAQEADARVLRDLVGRAERQAPDFDSALLRAAQAYAGKVDRIPEVKASLDVAVAARQAEALGPLLREAADLGVDASAAVALARVLEKRATASARVRRAVAAVVHASHEGSVTPEAEAVLAAACAEARALLLLSSASSSSSSSSSSGVKEEEAGEIPDLAVGEATVASVRRLRAALAAVEAAARDRDRGGLVDALEALDTFAGAAASGSSSSFVAAAVEQSGAVAKARRTRARLDTEARVVAKLRAAMADPKAPAEALAALIAFSYDQLGSGGDYDDDDDSRSGFFSETVTAAVDEATRVVAARQSDAERRDREAAEEAAKAKAKARRRVVEKSLSDAAVWAEEEASSGGGPAGQRACVEALDAALNAAAAEGLHADGALVLRATAARERVEAVWAALRAVRAALAELQQQQQQQQQQCQQHPGKKGLMMMAHHRWASEETGALIARAHAALDGAGALFSADLSKLRAAVKTAEARRAAVTALGKACSGDDEDLAAVKAALVTCGACGLAAATDADVAAGEAFRARLEQRRALRARLAAAVAVAVAVADAHHDDHLRGLLFLPAPGVDQATVDRLLADCVDADLAADDPAVAAVRAARSVLVRRRAAVHKIRRCAALAGRTRAPGDLEEALARAAEGLGLDAETDDDVAAAEDLLVELQCEALARAKLTAALGGTADHHHYHRRRDLASNSLGDGGGGGGGSSISSDEASTAPSSLSSSFQHQSKAQRNLALRSAIAAARREPGLADSFELKAAERELERREGLGARRAEVRAAMAARDAAALEAALAKLREASGNNDDEDSLYGEATRALAALEQSAADLRFREAETARRQVALDRQKALDKALRRAAAETDDLGLLDRLLEASLAEGAQDSEATLVANRARLKLRRLDYTARAVDLALAKRASSEVLRAAVADAERAWVDAPSCSSSSSAVHARASEVLGEAQVELAQMRTAAAATAALRRAVDRRAGPDDLKAALTALAVAPCCRDQGALAAPSSSLRGGGEGDDREEGPVEVVGIQDEALLAHDDCTWAARRPVVEAANVLVALAMEEAIGPLREAIAKAAARRLVGPQLDAARRKLATAEANADVEAATDRCEAALRELRAADGDAADGPRLKEAAAATLREAAAAIDRRLRSTSGGAAGGMAQGDDGAAPSAHVLKRALKFLKRTDLALKPRPTPADADAAAARTTTTTTTTTMMASSPTMREHVHWTRYPGLRSEESFLAPLEGRADKGQSEKGRARTLRFRHQTAPLHLPLTDPCDVTAARVAHRDVLAFCGEQYHQFPNEMGRDLLERGRDSALGGGGGGGGGEGTKRDDGGALADEIVLQLMKHCTANDAPKSASRAWRLLLLCCRTFPPSEALFPYVEAFVRTNATMTLDVLAEEEDEEAEEDDEEDDEDVERRREDAKRAAARLEAREVAGQLHKVLKAAAHELAAAPLTTNGRVTRDLPSVSEIDAAASSFDDGLAAARSRTKNNNKNPTARRSTTLSLKKSRLRELKAASDQLCALRPDLAPDLESSRAQARAALEGDDAAAIAAATEGIQATRRAAEAESALTYSVQRVTQKLLHSRQGARQYEAQDLESQIHLAQTAAAALVVVVAATSSSSSSSSHDDDDQARYHQHPILAEAMDVLDRVKAQIQARADLEEALASDSAAVVQGALLAAQRSENTHLKAYDEALDHANRLAPAQQKKSPSFAAFFGFGP